MKLKTKIFSCLAWLALVATAPAAQASCGSAFCVLNTNWSTQGVAAEAGSTRFDVHYEFVDQKHLQSGTRRASTADAAGEDATELRTINRNLVTTLDYALSRNWTASASVPVVSRSHSHIDNASGDTETWSLAKIGDARVLGFYRFDNEQNPVVNYGLTFGLKLPTGQYKVVNDEGVSAERALQPGSGSTDAVLGGYWSAPGAALDSSWFGQTLVQTPVASKDGFKPGKQIQLNLGYRHPFAHQLQGLLQVNALVKGRDSGDSSEPDLSGSRTVFLSPGLAYSVTHALQVYGFVQLPIYRHYNGIQLSVDWAVVAGLTARL